MVFSDDGQVVEKRFDRRWWWFLDHRHDKFDRERRVGMLLRRHPPPVATAQLLDADRRNRVLRFEAVTGGPLGPKFPLELPDHEVDDLIGVATVMSTYRPRAAFAKRFDLRRRLLRAVDHRQLSPATARRISQDAAEDPPTLAFGHGDITARNVLRHADGHPVLIDWEWAGMYPRGWDLAFLWLSLADVPGGRARVEAAVERRDITWFWRSALLIQLLHLSLPGLAPGSEFRPRHEQTKHEILGRLLPPGAT